MTADIDREKLRELCELATKAPWKTTGATLVYGFDGTVASCGEPRATMCVKYQEVEVESPNFAEACANADLIAAARTALPALLDLTDAQAAKIAELKSENVRLDENLSGFLDENRALHDDAEAWCDRIASLESERDQLRKQVEGQFVAGMRRAAEICDEVSEIAGMRPLRVGANVSRDAILSAASALEQKEQG